jgi:hypothetical protein
MTNRTLGVSWRFWGCLAVGLSTWSGCATIPSITPFSEQTDRMVTGINGGYTATQLSLAAVSQTQAKRLADEWKPSATALTGIVAYSQALTAVATAGGQGAQAAESVADAVNGLLSSFSVAAIPDAAVAGFKALNQQIAKIRAKRSLQGAVAEAQPAVDALANIMAAQLNDLAGIADSAAASTLNDHLESNKAMVEYVAAERKAEDRILGILRSILDYQALGAKASDEDLKAITNLDPLARRENIEIRETHWMDVVRRHQAHLAPYRDRYAEYVRREDELRASRRTAAATFAKAQTAVKAWAVAHGKLQAALDKKQPPDFSSFFAAVRDVASAFNEGRAVTE